MHGKLYSICMLFAIGILMYNYGRVPKSYSSKDLEILVGNTAMFSLNCPHENLTLLN